MKLKTADEIIQYSGCYHTASCYHWVTHDTLLEFFNSGHVLVVCRLLFKFSTYALYVIFIYNRQTININSCCFVVFFHFTTSLCSSDFIYFRISDWDSIIFSNSATSMCQTVFAISNQHKPDGLLTVKCVGEYFNTF